MLGVDHSVSEAIMGPRCECKSWNRIQDTKRKPLLKLKFVEADEEAKQDRCYCIVPRDAADDPIGVQHARGLAIHVKYSQGSSFTNDQVKVKCSVGR